MHYIIYTYNRYILLYIAINTNIYIYKYILYILNILLLILLIKRK